jgi:hypothetical protein
MDYRKCKKRGKQRGRYACGPTSRPCRRCSVSHGKDAWRSSPREPVGPLPRSPHGLLGHDSALLARHGPLTWGAPLVV